MENATKALLIAGSILIVIILIAMGVRIVGTGTTTVDEQQQAMQTTTVATFNSKFSAYAGPNKNKSAVQTLIGAVIANNANSSHKITLNGKTTISELNSLYSSLSEGTTYTITITGNDAEGYITSMSY